MSVEDTAQELERALELLPLATLNEAADLIEEATDLLYSAAAQSNDPDIAVVISQWQQAAGEIVRVIKICVDSRNRVENYRLNNLGSTSPCVSSPTMADKQTHVANTAKPDKRPPGVTEDPRTWPGSIVQDETSNIEKFSPDEEAIAKRLAQTGPNVVRRLPTREDVRTADATVNGDPVEFKTLQQKDRIVPTHKTVKKMISKSQKRGGQSPDVIIDGRGTDLSEHDARAGLKAYLNAPGNAGKLKRVRIWGKSFDLDWRHGQND